MHKTFSGISATIPDAKEAVPTEHSEKNGEISSVIEKVIVGTLPSLF